MFVRILKITLFLPGANSLKERRNLIKSVKDRLVNKFNISVCEVGELDLWQKATLGIAFVGNDMSAVNSTSDSILDFFHSVKDCQVIQTEKDIINFGDFFERGQA